MCDRGQGCSWIQAGTGVRWPAGSPRPLLYPAKGGLLPKTHTRKVKVQHLLLQALSITLKAG